MGVGKSNARCLSNFVSIKVNFEGEIIFWGEEL